MDPRAFCVELRCRARPFPQPLPTEGRRRAQSPQREEGLPACTPHPIRRPPPLVSDGRAPARSRPRDPAARPLPRPVGGRHAHAPARARAPAKMAGAGAQLSVAAAAAAAVLPRS